MTFLRPRTRPVLQLGFTLIELMIAVAIVAILARIATVVYKNYVIRANRADAQQTLLQAAQNLERWYVVNNGSYSGWTIAPDHSPTTTTTASKYMYSITAPTLTATTFLLKATPASTNINASDGFLQIDNTGVKGWDKNNNGTIDTGESTWTP